MKKDTPAEMEKPLHGLLKKMIERGIPVERAEFHSAVNNGDEVPENYFCKSSDKESRRVQMWWINGDGLLCCHHTKTKGDIYFMVPSASVKFHRFEELTQ